MKKNKLNLALFVDPESLGAFLEFRADNSLGKCYNAETKRTLGMALALTRPYTGFLWDRSALYTSKPEVRRKLPNSFEDERGRKIKLTSWDSRWKNWCTVTHKKISELRKRIIAGGGFQKSFDPKVGIAQILDQPSPWQSIMRLEKPMWEHSIPDQWIDYRRAFEFCKRLYVSFQLRYPFRVGTFAEILVTDFVDNGKAVEMILPPERFKTHRFHDDDYKIKLDVTLLDNFIAYRDVHRPVLVGKSRTPYFFLLSPINGHVLGDRTKFENIFGTAIQAISQRYLAELCPAGFRPHAVRHIVATDLILRDPLNGWKRAAMALWEREDTVRETYSHLGNRELLREFHSLVAEVSKAGGSSPFPASYSAHV